MRANIDKIRAALQLNGVFEAAQAACQQYEENLRLRCQALENQEYDWTAQMDSQEDLMMDWEEQL